MITINSFVGSKSKYYYLFIDNYITNLFLIDFFMTISSRNQFSDIATNVIFFQVFD